MSQQQQRTSRSNSPQTNLYQSAVNIPEESRVPVIQALNQALANTTDLQTQAKFAHWNVKGIDFFQLHLLFDEVAETLSEHVDLLAERATALGGQAMGTTRIAAETSRIPEPPTDAVEDVEYVEWLTDHVAHHANFLREAIAQAAELGDEDTADLFTELSREVDTQLYFLEAHLQTEVRDRVPATASQAPGTQSGTPPRIGDQQGVSRSIAGPESGASQIEIQEGAPQAMAPTRGGGQPPGAPQEFSQPPGGPQDISQDVGQPMSAPPSVPQDVGQQMDASGGSLQGGPHGFRQEQRSVPSQQQPPVQSGQQTQFQPQRGPAQSEQLPVQSQQQGAIQSGRQEPPVQSQQPPIRSQQQSLPPQQQGFEGQQPPLSQPPDYQGGAQTFDAPGGGFQDFPGQPGP